MAKFLRVLSIIVLVLGILGTIFLAFKFGTAEKTVATYLGVPETKTSFNVGLFFGYLVGGGLSTTILYAILGGLSEVLEKLEYHDKKLVEINSLLEKGK